jgi:hypothetical protein
MGMVHHRNRQQHRGSNGQMGREEEVAHTERVSRKARAVSSSPRRILSAWSRSERLCTPDELLVDPGDDSTRAWPRAAGHRRVAPPPCPSAQAWPRGARPPRVDLEQVHALEPLHHPFLVPDDQGRQLERAGLVAAYRRAEASDDESGAGAGR